MAADSKKFNPAGFALFVLAASALGALVWQFLNKSAPFTAPSAYELFDRAKASELENKGELPLGAESWSEIEIPPEPAVSPASIGRGRELFKNSCAGCHGAEGKGDGPIARKFELPSRPANLTQPLHFIKIHSTLDPKGGGIPLGSDLFRTLTRGLPGTAMYSYRALPAGDRWALVHFIRTLAPDYAQPSSAAAIPDKPDDGSNFSAIGGELYRTVCLNCHGEKALGGTALLRDSETGQVFPGLQFAREGGVQMLGGSSERDIARTLLAGLNGRSPMRSLRAYLYPSENMTPEEKRDADRKFWGVVVYARGLIEAQGKK